MAMRTEQTDNKLEATLGLLFEEIERWRRRTWQFRYFNLALFIAFRFLIPAGSLSVAALVFLASQGELALPPSILVGLASLVTVCSGFDSVLNPAARKRAAFRRYNELTNMSFELSAECEKLPSDQLREVVARFSSALRKAMDQYVEEGY